MGKRGAPRGPYAPIPGHVRGAMTDSLASFDAAWRAAVSVREEVELSQLLTERMPRESAPRAVSVTDLIAPRRAFWRAVSPVQPDPTRQHRLDIGRRWHRRLGVALSDEGALEVRVRRGGVVGRIDLLSDVPVEVKTSASSVEPEQLRQARPDQVEQLAMYCALADRPSGRLVTLLTGEDGAGRIQAVDIGFGDTENIRTEMGRRADAIRAAWTEQRPSGLPACRWYGRGCEFQDAEVCDCTGSEPVDASSILSGVRAVTERTDIAGRIESRLHEIPTKIERPTIERFRDLLYPRRAYFERTTVEPIPEFARPGPLEPVDLYARLTEAVETG